MGDGRQLHSSSQVRRSLPASGQLVALSALLGFLFLTVPVQSPSDTVPVPGATSLPRSAVDGPHEKVSCIRCHTSVEENPGTKNVKYDVGQLCWGCHEHFSYHPVGVAVDLSVDRLSELSLPLVDHGGAMTITCLTCHHFHGMRTNQLLLRTSGGRTKGDRYKGLCCECHLEEELRTMSPHSRSRSSCSLCHSDIPEKGQTVSPEEYTWMQGRCDFCHGLVAGDHYRSIDPLAEQSDVERSGGLELISIGGEYACFGCHDPHGDQAEGTKLLKSDYLELAALSRLINPHWKNVMCVTCHTGRPGKDRPMLRRGGDVNGLCSRCHDNEVAPAFLHPVGCEPSDKVRIPDDMPLKEGRITCQTCHNSSLQESGENLRVELRGNPGFLRKGGSPGTFCVLCHIEEEFSKVNVHKQVDENGEIITGMCSGCHYVLPEDSGEPTIVIETKYDPREYCLLCHKKDTYMQNHPAGPHLVEPSRDVLYMLLSAEKRIGAPLPLYEDRITCSTCHDPHQRGVLRRHEWIEGGKGGGRVRAEYREILCTGCHE